MILTMLRAVCVLMLWTMFMADTDLTVLMLLAVSMLMLLTTWKLWTACVDVMGCLCIDVTDSALRQFCVLMLLTVH